MLRFALWRRIKAGGGLGGRDIKMLLSADLSEEWKNGNIQGISLNGIIKRVSNTVLDNDKEISRGM